MTINQYVTSAGEFKWKPKLAPKDVSEEFNNVVITNGVGTNTTIQLNSLPVRVWKLQFAQSPTLFKEMRSFLMGNGYGAKSFTWYNHLDGELVTVRQLGSISFRNQDDNTPDQDPLAIESEITLVEHFGV